MEVERKRETQRQRKAERERERQRDSDRERDDKLCVRERVSERTKNKNNLSVK